MKKMLFLAVSALIAGASYCTSAGEKVVAKVTKSDNVIKQLQEQPLILEQFSAESDLLAAHYSHSSHRSHSSHSSHRSHYSSR
ncbi:MAG: hypothetical protein SNH79_01105 [Rikenellaceae bacterium]